MTDLLLDLTRRYSEPHRHYHTLRHVAEMLLQGCAFPLTDEQVMAVWFHDAVYNPRSRTNETESAALARLALARAGWQTDAIDRVAGMILDTAGHQPSQPQSGAVLDLDLAVLAAEPGAYGRYVASVRAEYAFVPDAEWRAGRCKWALAMLARERLFWTPWGIHKEEAARHNLEAEAQALAV